MGRRQRPAARRAPLHGLVQRLDEPALRHLAAAPGRTGRCDPGEELPPTLILQAERDAATPYLGGVEPHQRRLPGSGLVVELDAGSHGVPGGTNSCVNARVDAYLLEGVVEAGEAVGGDSDWRRPGLRIRGPSARMR